MTDTSEWDPTGEVATELRNAVEIYGDRALSSKQLLENFFSDPFPKGNKGANLLISAADAGVAVSLRRHLDEGLDPDNAVMLAGREFEDTMPVPAGSGLWVATQMAAVLRIQVSDRLAQRASSPQPVHTPVGPGPGPGPEPDPVVDEPNPQEEVDGDGRPHKLGEQTTLGATDTPQPPRRPRSRTDETTAGGGRNRTPLIVAGALALALVVYLIVAAAGHLAPFSKSTTTTLTLPPPTTPAPTTPTPTNPTQPTLAQLMPDQNSSDPLLVQTDCGSVSPLPAGLTGVTSSYGCSVPGQDGWQLFGYQFDTSADYARSVTTYLGDKGFDAGQAAPSCPPGSGYQVGQIGWNNSSYPAASGQNLQCLLLQDSSNSNASDPAYIWELPSRDALFEVIGSSSSSFSDVDSWWTDDGLPSA